MNDKNELINRDNPSFQKVMQITKKLQSEGVNFNANQNISKYVNTENLEVMKECLTEIFSAMLELMLLDNKNDPHLIDTHRRIARMYVDEILIGRFKPEPKITLFPNENNDKQLCVVGPMKVRTLCSHHFLPVVGHVSIGIIYGEKVLGLSKFKRIIDWIISRPHIQEQAAVMIADYIEEKLKPRGLCVYFDARHECMLWRGVKAERATFANIVKRGEFSKKDSLNEEFMQLINRSEL